MLHIFDQMKMLSYSSRYGDYNSETKGNFKYGWRAPTPPLTNTIPTPNPNPNPNTPHPTPIFFLSQTGQCGLFFQ